MKKILIFVGLSTLIVIGSYLVWQPKASAPAYSKPFKNPASTSPKTTAKQVFNKHLYSLTDPASIWVVVNKQRPLSPKDYAPTDLVIPDVPLRSNITNTEKHVRKPTAEALKTMVDAAKASGINLNLQSGYRSYNFQSTLYNSYVAQQGQTAADTQSARAGYSEHQTGLAADLGGTSNPSCNVADCFATTPEGLWLAANAYHYGFIIRYPADKQAVTGYIYEPWHVRYVGTELSNELHKQSVTTLEEFFNLPSAPTY